MSYRRTIVVARKCINCKSPLYGIPGSGAYEGVVCKNCNVCNGVCSGKHCKSPNSLGYLVKHGMIYNGIGMMALSEHFYFRCSDCLAYEKNKCVFCDGDDGCAVSNQNDLIFDIICESCYTIRTGPPCERCNVQFPEKEKKLCKQCDEEVSELKRLADERLKKEQQRVIIAPPPVISLEKKMFNLRWNAINSEFINQLHRFQKNEIVDLTSLKNFWNRYPDIFIRVVKENETYQKQLLEIEKTGKSIQTYFSGFPMLENGNTPQIELIDNSSSN
jgi:hypothetical protein